MGGRVLYDDQHNHHQAIHPSISLHTQPNTRKPKRTRVPDHVLRLGVGHREVGAGLKGDRLQVVPVIGLGVVFFGPVGFSGWIRILWVGVGRRRRRWWWSV